MKCRASNIFNCHYHEFITITTISKLISFSKPNTYVKMKHEKKISLEMSNTPLTSNLLPRLWERSRGREEERAREPGCLTSSVVHFVLSITFHFGSL